MPPPRRPSRRTEILGRVEETLLALPHAGLDGATLTPEVARRWMDRHPRAAAAALFLRSIVEELIAQQIVLAKRAEATGPAIKAIPCRKKAIRCCCCAPRTLPGLVARVVALLAALEVNPFGAPAWIRAKTAWPPTFFWVQPRLET